ncbi:MAG: hypothetical protein CVU55_07655 [Deltaproteobacteria bacterium HGW-Deltaproteobacteria-13]|jgi:hypothetical protein|nr:MAG: hypothetical protein CVU55_07655 [Deltaproteobacteria bacterium HGW-Deltaproteobacteria-13]
MMEWIANNSGAIIALSTVVISLISLFVAVKALNTQREHNKLSVKPIAHFSKGDYENQIFVKVKNYGLGPLIIEEFNVSKEKCSFKRLVDSFDGLGALITWDTFTDDIEGRVLAPQNEFILIKASFTPDQDDIRKAIRESLANTTLTIKYKCIYDEVQPEVQEKLEWFARS